MKIQIERPVESIMQGIETKELPGQRPIIVAVPDDPLKKAEDWFLHYHVHHLPIVASLGNPTLVGILSTVDIIEYYSKHPGADLNQVKIEQMMVKDPQTIAPHTTIKAAIEVFAQASFQSLPVVDARGHCVGIVTLRDIINVFADELKQT